MTTALLYQPRQRWRVGAAFGAAVLIHFAVIALANAHRETKPEDPSGDGFPEITILDPSPVDEPPANVDDQTPTPPPTDESSFPEDRPTPPPVRRQVIKSVTPIVKPTHGMPGSLTMPSASVLAVSAPRPEYPYEARRARITGNGIAVMVVDPVNGLVTDVTMSESTGSPVLDNAAMAGFRRWRFKPGTASQIKVPITFTMTGAMY
jgi:protein TonB